MGNDVQVTPKGTLTLKSLGSGFSKENVGTAGLATFKYKKNDVTASVEITDGTLKDVKSLKDVVAKVDYKVAKAKGVTLNSKYDLATKKYQVGATWEGKVSGKSVTAKGYYSNKDNKVAGEVTAAVVKNGKANVVFNQEKLTSAKYTLTNGDFTYEPSYNFDKEAAAIAVTKKQGKDTFKLSYDLKSENATLEWNRKPFKVSATSAVSKKASISKPNVSVVFENTYEL